MKASRYYWKGTRAILFFGLLVSGCAAFKSPKAVSFIENGRERSYESTASVHEQRQVFKSFCSGGKQIRSMKLNIAFVLPKNPAGQSLDVVADGQVGLEARRKCLSKELLYRLSKADCAERGSSSGYCASPDGRAVAFVSSGDSLAKILDEVKGVPLFVGEYSNIRVEPVFVSTNDGKKIVGFFDRVTSRADGGLERSVKYAGSFRRDAFLFELSVLINGFAIIEPQEFQEEAYGSREMNLCRMTGITNKILAVKKDGSADIAEAIDQRSAIWQRYIFRHSKIKESFSQDAQVVDMEVSLDLTDFCRYGRHIEDLTSS